MLSNYRAVHFPSIRKYDIAIDQLGKQELMHSSRRRVNPAELVGRQELLWTERPGDGDLGIAQMGFYAFIGVEVNNLKLRKFLLQPLGQPARSVPELEAVMQHDEEFHPGEILMGKDEQKQIPRCARDDRLLLVETPSPRLI